MGRWDPAPTSLQRWMVHHLVGIRCVAVLWIALCIGWAGYVLATAGLAPGFFSAVLSVGGPSALLLSTFLVARHVERYDTGRSDQQKEP